MFPVLHTTTSSHAGDAFDESLIINITMKYNCQQKLLLNGDLVVYFCRRVDRNYSVTLFFENDWSHIGLGLNFQIYIHI